MTHHVPRTVAGVIGPARRSIGLHRLLDCLLCGVAVGAIAGASLVLAREVLLLPMMVVAIALAAGLAAGLIRGIRQWPTELETARHVDMRFGLQDRITTALLLRRSTESLHQLQRADALAHAADLPLTRSGRGQTRSRSALLCLAALGACGALAVLMPAGHRVQASMTEPGMQAVHQVAAAEVPTVVPVSSAAATGGRTGAAVTRVQAQMKRLQQALAHAQSRAAALRAVSVAQQQLHSDERALRPADRQSIQSIQRSLSGFGRTGQGAQTSSALAAAQTLKRLASALDHMPLKQRRALARALKQAASSVSDQRLRADLRSASSAISKNDTAKARLALQHAARVMAQTPDVRNLMHQIKTADHRLDQIKRNIRRVQPRMGTRSGSDPAQQAHLTGHQGRPQSNGSAGQTSRPKGSSPSGSPASRSMPHRANSGPVTSSSMAGTTGREAGRPVLVPRKGGVGGHIPTDPQGNAGRTKRGRYVKIYVPAHHGTGPHTIQIFFGGASGSGRTATYREVLAQYSGAAAVDLSHSALPPDVERYVRRYFVTLAR